MLIEILSRILDDNDLVALDARKNKAYVFDGEVLGVGRKFIAIVHRGKRNGCGMSACGCLCGRERILY